jgi:hypothetical protein
MAWFPDRTERSWRCRQSHHGDHDERQATSANCLRYWDLANHIRIDDAVALWCGVEPAQFAGLKFETRCMSAKRAALVIPVRFVRHKARKVVIEPTPPERMASPLNPGRPTSVDGNLMAALARAFFWQELLDSGPAGTRCGREYCQGPPAGRPVAGVLHAQVDGR